MSFAADFHVLSWAYYSSFHLSNKEQKSWLFQNTIWNILSTPSDSSSFVSQKVASHAARLNEAAISLVKRVPIIRPALPSSVVGMNQWSMMSLRWNIMHIYMQDKWLMWLACVIWLCYVTSFKMVQNIQNMLLSLYRVCVYKYYLFDVQIGWNCLMVTKMWWTVRYNYKKSSKRHCVCVNISRLLQKISFIVSLESEFYSLSNTRLRLYIFFWCSC